MPKASPIYPTFSSGEISPLLYGRTDLKQYYNGLEIAENMLVRPYGLIMNRPGSLFKAEVKFSNRFTRLLEFIFNENDAFVIEMGHLYFRFYTLGAQVSGPYEVAHTYTEAELPDVHIAQKNDVIDITHPDHPPATLTRIAANNWVLANETFIGGPVQDTNTTATTITPSADTGNGITLTASSSIFLAGHVGSTWRVKGGYVDIVGYTSGTVVTANVQAGGNLGTGPGATTDWAEAAWSNVAGWPATVTYHERRRWYARTVTQPQTQWASKPFIYDDFTVGANDDDALNLTLATDLASDIKWMSSGTTLATGTFGGEFITSSGATGVSMTPSNANATRHTGWGSENIQPKKIGSSIYYVQRGYMKVRELFYFWDVDTYKSIDMTVLSDHITESGIRDIAYQQNPDPTLWCVRNDGQIATFVREEDQGVKAWTRQVTDGSYESVAVIPSAFGPYDEVWVVVKRTINGSVKRYVEKFTSPLLPTRQQDMFFVDCGLAYKSYDQTTGKTLTLSALTGAITATSSVGHFAANDVGQRLRAIDANGNMIGEMKITGYTSPTIVTGTSTYNFSALGYAANKWGVSVDIVSGLSHLEAKEVSILADGAVQSRKTVATGSITLDRDAFELSIGLPYTSKIKTLSVEAGAADGTAQGKKKRIFQLGLRVYRTLGIKVGGSMDKLYIITLRDPQTQMGTPEDLVTGILPNIRFTGGWVYEGTVIIVQDNPLPMAILDIMPMLKEMDK